jgi:hypothetical protein
MCLVWARCVPAATSSDRFALPLTLYRLPSLKR